MNARRWFEKYDAVSDFEDFLQSADMLAHKKYVPVNALGLTQKAVSALVEGGFHTLFDLLDSGDYFVTSCAKGDVALGRELLSTHKFWAEREQSEEVEIEEILSKGYPRLKKVLWLSRHDPSPSQVMAVQALHGSDVEIVKDAVVLDGVDGLADYIRNHPDSSVYSVAGPHHYVAATIAGLPFGVFENHPQKRQDGSFGLAAVYHTDNGSLKRVWVNPDPMSDKGEALIPVVR